MFKDDFTVIKNNLVGFVRNNSKQEDLLEYTNKCCTKYCKIDNEVSEWTIENEPLCDCPISYFYYAMVKLAAWEHRGLNLDEYLDMTAYRGNKGKEILQLVKENVKQNKEI